MSECTHNCDSCGESCPSRQDPKSMLEKPHELSKIKKVIGVVSGKGGVGKSLVTSLSAVESARLGYKTAILDADITGPSIPRSFGLTEKATGTETGLYPVKTSTGISVMSLNLLTENETDPVVWRGPMIAGVVKQFWTDVIWGDVDYMFIDCPPGTGDVPLTVFQSIKLDGVIIVTTPQDLVSMIVGKAVHMAEMMNIPIIGLVENMSYVKCPDCGREINVFGKSKAEEVCKEYGIELIGRMPIDEKLSSLVDHGVIELMDNDYLDSAADSVEKFCEKN